MGAWVPAFPPSLRPASLKSIISGSGSQVGGEVRAEGAYLSQADDEDMSALKGERHLLQEVESLWKVPKTKSVNKREKQFGLTKLDSANLQSDFGLLDPGDWGML